MSFVKSIVGTFAVTSTLMACSATPTRSRGWSLNMRGMAESYEKLVPYIYDRQRFNDPNNSKFIKLYLTQLNQNASDLNRHTARGLSGNDPLFKVGLKGLKTQIEKASEAYFVESYDYSQKLLKSSVNYCNSCHTRTNLGPTFIKWDQFEDVTAKLSPLDHAHILIATRQFPKSVEVLQKGFFAPTTLNGQRDEILKTMLTVTLKNLNSPQQALNIVNETPEKMISPEIRDQLKTWKIYLKKWVKSDVASSVRELIAQNQNDAQHFVKNLHDSTLLHNSLSSEKDASVRAETYYALGKIYENIPQVGSWNLPETYFETCIYQNPGSKMALKCYYDLESRLKEDSERKQTKLLIIEQAKLNKLKAVAKNPPDKSNKMTGGFGFEDL